jgi:hypothetical protein
MASRRLYTSSSGDTWDLVQEEGRVAVKHSPNPASGGQPATIDIAGFLSGQAGSPEQIALLDLIATLVNEEEDAVLAPEQLNASNDE